MFDLGYHEQDIILVGRSMGSGPCCHLAGQFKNVAALILVSPYTSLKAATRSLFGSVASLLVRERFDNLKAMEQVRCPTLIIHGAKDTLIPDSHAKELYSKCVGASRLIMPVEMTHNEYDIHTDVVKPISQFLTESNIMSTLLHSKRIIPVSSSLYLPPKFILDSTPKA